MPPTVHEIEWSDLKDLLRPHLEPEGVDVDRLYIHPEVFREVLHVETAYVIDAPTEGTLREVLEDMLFYGESAISNYQLAQVMAVLMGPEYEKIPRGDYLIQ